MAAPAASGATSAAEVFRVGSPRSECVETGPQPQIPPAYQERRGGDTAASYPGRAREPLSPGAGSHSTAARRFRHSIEENRETAPDSRFQVRRLPDLDRPRLGQFERNQGQFEDDGTGQLREGLPGATEETPQVVTLGGVEEDESGPGEVRPFHAGQPPADDFAGEGVGAPAAPEIAFERGPQERMYHNGEDGADGADGAGGGNHAFSHMHEARQAPDGVAGAVEAEDHFRHASMPLRAYGDGEREAAIYYGGGRPDTAGPDPHGAARMQQSASMALESDLHRRSNKLKAPRRPSGAAKRWKREDIEDLISGAFSNLAARWQNDFERQQQEAAKLLQVAEQRFETAVVELRRVFEHSAGPGDRSTETGSETTAGGYTAQREQMVERANVLLRDAVAAARENHEQLVHAWQHRVADLAPALADQVQQVVVAAKEEAEKSAAAGEAEVRAEISKNVREHMSKTTGELPKTLFEPFDASEARNSETCELLQQLVDQVREITRDGTIDSSPVSLVDAVKAQLAAKGLRLRNVKEVEDFPRPAARKAGPALTTAVSGPMDLLANSPAAVDGPGPPVELSAREAAAPAAVSRGADILNLHANADAAGGRARGARPAPTADGPAAGDGAGASIPAPPRRRSADVGKSEPSASRGAEAGSDGERGGPPAESHSGADGAAAAVSKLEGHRADDLFPRDSKRKIVPSNLFDATPAGKADFAAAFGGGVGGARRPPGAPGAPGAPPECAVHAAEPFARPPLAEDAWGGRKFDKRALVPSNLFGDDETQHEPAPAAAAPVREPVYAAAPAAQRDAPGSSHFDGSAQHLGGGRVGHPSLLGTTQHGIHSGYHGGGGVLGIGPSAQGPPLPAGFYSGSGRPTLEGTVSMQTMGNDYNQQGPHGIASAEDGGAGEAPSQAGGFPWAAPSRVTPQRTAPPRQFGPNASDVAKIGVGQAGQPAFFGPPPLPKNKFAPPPGINRGNFGMGAKNRAEPGSRPSLDSSALPSRHEAVTHGAHSMGPRRPALPPDGFDKFK